jgi:H+-translocating NAD(P) transhydrogenase subunit alpha
MKDNIITIDWDDEILAKTVLTHAGELKGEAAEPVSTAGRDQAPANKSAKKVT